VDLSVFFAPADGDALGAPDPDPSPEPAENRLAAPSPEKDADPAYWRQRAQSIQGMFDKFRNEAAPREQELTHQVRQLTDALANLGKSTTTAPDMAPPPVVTLDDITDEEVAKRYSQAVIDEYGLDELKLKIAERRTDQAIAEADARKRAGQESQAREAQGQFWSQVNRLVRETHPDVDAAILNASDQGWFGFLNEPEGVAGTPRRTGAGQAVATGDAATVAKYILAYLDASRESTVRRQAAPQGRPVGPRARPATQQKPVYTTQQVDAFYDAVRRGTFEGTQAQRQQIERQIADAAGEGRIRH